MSYALPNGQSVSLPSFPKAGDLAVNVQQALKKLKPLMTNFNTGGLTQTYIEALCVLLGSDASTLPGSTLEGAYELLSDVLKGAYIATATGDALRLKCADVGVYPKAATVAGGSGYFTLPSPATGSGTVYRAGTILSLNSADPTQPPILYLILADATVPNGATQSNIIAYNAVQPGSGGNQPNPVTMQVQSSSIGTFTTTGPTSGGTDTETDVSLRSRGLQAIPNASQCTISAIQAAALSYSGIVSATLLDSTANDGLTFQRGVCQLYVDDGTGTLGAAVNNPNLSNQQSVVSFNQLQSDLNSGKWRGAGVTVNLKGSTTLNVTLVLSINVATPYLALGNTQNSVQIAVQNAILTYVNGLPMAHPLTLASVIEIAKQVAGVSNVLISTVQINGSAADLVPLSSQVIRCANLGAVTVNVSTTTAYS